MGALTSTDIGRFRRRILDWGSENGRSFPWRSSTDPYEVLVGELLLQRTRGDNVAPVYMRFLDRWPTVEGLARARPATIGRVIAPLGLSKRATVLRDVARRCVQLGGVPDDPDALMALPGVGPYVGHAVPVFASGRDLPLVDWVIARVLRRYFGLEDGRRPNADVALWSLAETLARRGRARALWLATLDLAAAACAPRPRCDHCPLRAHCGFYRRVR